jgi:DNA adenine methylase
MSINGGTNPSKTDWQHWRDWIDSHHKSPETQMGSIENVYQVAYRLQHVQIECRDAIDVIQTYDHPNSLIYFDPPYVNDTRAQPERYLLEWVNTDHVEAADILRQCTGYIVVSGYACDLYRELYEDHGWTRADKEAQTNSGGKRIESLWLSPRTVEALQMPEQLEMFQ